MKFRSHIFSQVDDLVIQVSNQIIDAANRCIAERGAFHIVLAGGTTPEAIYEHLGTLSSEWSAWHVYFGDERFLPRGDFGRNETMVSMAWLDQVTIPCHQVFPMAVSDSLEQAANDYTEVLAKAPRFDMVLLGLGEDGHTASLFPGHDLGESKDAPNVLIITEAPKPPSQRLSISANKLSQADQVFFIVTGENKVEPISRWQEDGSIPAAAIQPTNGVDVFLDQAATPKT